MSQAKIKRAQDLWRSFKLYEVGHAVSIKYKSKKSGQFLAVYKTLNEAKKVAANIFKNDLSVEAVRVYTKNKPSYKYGLSIVFSLARKNGKEKS